MRLFRFALVLFALLVVAVPAGADEVYPITFPVDGDSYYYSDTYDAPRGGGRLHEATDIMAPKGTPVLAAAAGTVDWMSSGNYTDCNGHTAPSYTLRLMHDDGYQSWYIHLNNDNPGTDDGLAYGYAPGIQVGTHVEAGQLVGWLGDSGNAECVTSHLHFQLHYPTGERFNPYPSLLAAEAAADAQVLDDEIFFYRSTDGAFRYYDIQPNGALGSPILSGSGYSTGWDSISAIDLDGDDQDEQFFYRSSDGAFRYYDIGSDAKLGSPIQSGTGYSTGWDSISAIDLDGDGSDEQFFYRSSDG
ncbi:MAG TPA: M23 family metallopeptidase, partial [Acidimicrobiia bacterium]|nr:M23 family metallopeptidase [Acidimicrobiia bacterium]